MLSQHAIYRLLISIVCMQNEGILQQASQSRALLPYYVACGTLSRPSSTTDNSKQKYLKKMK